MLCGSIILEMNHRAPEHQSGTLPEKADAVLLIGPTGSGKTPLGGLLQERGLSGRCCKHFDFGAQLRRAASLSGPHDLYTFEEQQFVRQVLEGGALLEDRNFVLAEKILFDFLERTAFRPGDWLVLNGLPRHVGQARSMDELAGVQFVVVLECEAEDILRRIARNTGRDRTGREDDSLEMVKKKLILYAERTVPLIDHYAQRGVRIIRLSVGADTSAADVYESLAAIT